MQDTAPLDLRRDYFATLRDEIRATKARIFVVLMVSIIGAPLLTFFAMRSESQLLTMIAPLIVMLLLILYLAEQTLLMRAGRYIRDHVEGKDSDWERWVGSLGLRSAERQLFALFVILGLFFFTVLLLQAIAQIIAIEVGDARDYEYYFRKYGISVMYAVATIWGLVTIIRFWHAAVSTSD